MSYTLLLKSWRMTLVFKTKWRNLRLYTLMETCESDLESSLKSNCIHWIDETVTLKNDELSGTSKPAYYGPTTSPWWELLGHLLQPIEWGHGRCITSAISDSSRRCMHWSMTTLRFIRSSSLGPM